MSFSFKLALEPDTDVSAAIEEAYTAGAKEEMAVLIEKAQAMIAAAAGALGDTWAAMEVAVSGHVNPHNLPTADQPADYLTLSLAVTKYND